MGGRWRFSAAIMESGAIRCILYRYLMALGDVLTVFQMPGGSRIIYYSPNSSIYSHHRKSGVTSFEDLLCHDLICCLFMLLIPQRVALLQCRWSDAPSSYLAMRLVHILPRGPVWASCNFIAQFGLNSYGVSCLCIVGFRHLFGYF